MSKLGEDILMGMENVTKYLEGNKRGTRKYIIKVPSSVNVKKIRCHLKLTQEKFANSYGFTLKSVQDWEQGRRQPERAARVLLKVIEYNPGIVEQALQA